MNKYWNFKTNRPDNLSYQTSPGIAFLLLTPLPSIDLDGIPIVLTVVILLLIEVVIAPLLEVVTIRFVYG